MWHLTALDLTTQDFSLGELMLALPSSEGNLIDWFLRQLDDSLSMTFGENHLLSLLHSALPPLETVSVLLLR